MSTRQKIDKFLGRWISRKLTVFIIASIALFSDKLTSTDWVIIATSYIAIQGITDIVERLMKLKGGAY